MMKPKTALVKDGFLPEGSENKRGRLSSAAIKRLEELASKGWSIEGYGSAIAVKATAQTEKVESTGMPDVPEASRDEAELEAYVVVNGVRETIGMRKVCNGCQSSLTYCHCPAPWVWVDSNSQAMVGFKNRTSPLPKKRW